MRGHSCFLVFQSVLPIMNEYAEVETCVEVRNQMNSNFSITISNSNFVDLARVQLDLCIGVPCLTVFSQNSQEHQRGVLLCTESRPPSNGTSISTGGQRGNTHSLAHSDSTGVESIWKYVIFMVTDAC